MPSGTPGCVLQSCCVRDIQWKNPVRCLWSRVGAVLDIVFYLLQAIFGPLGQPGISELFYRAGCVAVRDRAVRELRDGAGRSAREGASRILAAGAPRYHCQSADDYGSVEKGFFIAVETGRFGSWYRRVETIPGDGEIIEGIASVDESAITGESAPVIREAGGDRSGNRRNGGVLSDRIVVKITKHRWRFVPGTDDPAGYGSARSVNELPTKLRSPWRCPRLP